MLNSDGRCLIVMTTGTGKTVVGSKVMRRYPKDRILWLTQTEELITQTQIDLQKLFPEETVGLFKRAQRTLSERIVVASLQTIEKDDYLKEIDPKHFDLLIVDEAHHGAARTWKKVIQYFKAKRLGLTATPHRQDGKGLEDLFGQAAFELHYEEAKKYRLIAEEVYRVILTNSKIEGVLTNSGEYSANELDRLVVSQDRNHIIVDSYKRYGRRFMDEKGLPRKAICFCITVAHAIRMRDLFRHNGISSEVLVSKHSKYGTVTGKGNPLTEKDRREVYASFLDNTGPEILCVVNVLNEGKNIPDVACLMMARPTRSATIFMQQMGRGCRRIEGLKESFIVLDYVDLMNQKFPPMTLARVTGEQYTPEQIVLDYYRGSDPIVVDQYVKYLSPAYRFEEHKWTKAEVVKVLKAYYKKHKKVRLQDLGMKAGLPSRFTIHKFWKSVRACFESLGIPYGEAKTEWTLEQAKKAILEFAAKKGRILISDLGSKNNLPSQKTVYRYWGTWSNCEYDLDLKDWNSTKIAFAIQQFQKLHGRPPRKREWTKTYGLPSPGAVRKIFGSFSKAIASA